MTFIMGSWTLGAALLFSAIKNMTLLELIKGEPGKGQPDSIVDQAYAEAGEKGESVQRPSKANTKTEKPIKVGGKLTAAQYNDCPQDLKPGIEAVTATILKRWPKLTITATSNGTHVSNSYHYKHRAVDLSGGGTQYEKEAAAWIKLHLTLKLVEGIHNPNLAVKDHVLVPSSVFSAVWAEHANHIHVAV